MGLFERYLHVRIVSAEPETLITKLLFANVELWDVTYIDFLTIELKIKKNQFHDLQRVLEKNGSSGRVLGKEGVLWGFQGILMRPVLIVGIILFLLIIYFLPSRIFFIKVVGNEKIPDGVILAQAEDCGIAFGTKASKVRSEEAKNQLLMNLPQLQWLGITTSGSVATIHVKERSEFAQKPAYNDRISSIIAARDGIITQMTVYKGNPLFQTGQFVKEGDTLVSGYTDCGIKLKAEHAQADIFAHTLRQIQIVAPFPSNNRGEYTGKHTCYMVHIGKKVINLCNHSGILDATCVKMYEEDYWTLPGDFQLPVSVIKVEHLFYESVMEEEENTWLPQFAREYLNDQMIAGEILDEKLQWDISDDIAILNGEYACHEMIGQVKYEEIIEHNAEDN